MHFNISKMVYKRTDVHRLSQNLPQISITGFLIELCHQDLGFGHLAIPGTHICRSFMHWHSGVWFGANNVESPFFSRLILLHGRTT